MTGLDRINKRIYDTYHDPKNTKVLPIVIFFNILVVIFKNFLFWEFLIWLVYYYYCCYNNSKLNRDPNNLRERESLLIIKQKLLNGQLTFKK